MITQPRERPAVCWCGRTTWNTSALCDPHNPATTSAAATTPAARTAGHSTPAGQHVAPLGVLADIAPQ